MLLTSLMQRQFGSKKVQSGSQRLPQCGSFFFFSVAIESYAFK